MLKQSLRKWLGIQELNDLLAQQRKHYPLEASPNRQFNHGRDFGSQDDMWPEPTIPHEPVIDDGGVRKGYASVRRVT